jgi:hypothetical protein
MGIKKGGKTMTLSISGEQNNYHVILPGTFKPVTAESKGLIGELLDKYGKVVKDEEPVKTKEVGETEETPSTEIPVVKDTGDIDLPNLFGVRNLEDLIKKLQEILNKQKNARAELDEKESSMGIKYADAKKVIEEIEAKYQKGALIKYEDGKYSFNFGKAFDPFSLPEPDRARYLQALAACIEIENANPELAANAGCQTEYPEKSNNDNGFLYGAVEVPKDLSKPILRKDYTIESKIA